MMGSGGGSPNQASVLDGLLALVSNPEALGEKLRQLQEAQAAHDQSAEVARKTADDIRDLLAEARKLDEEHAATRASLDQTRQELAARAAEIEAQRQAVQASLDQVQRDTALVEAKRQENEAWYEKAKAEVRDMENRANADIQQSRQQAQATHEAQDAALTQRKADLDAREHALNGREATLADQERAVEELRVTLQTKLTNLQNILSS